MKAKISILFLLLSACFGAFAQTPSPGDKINYELRVIGAPYSLYPKADSLKLAGIAVSGSTSASGLQGQINTLNATKLNLSDSSKFVNKLSGYRLISPAEITKLAGIASGATAVDSTALLRKSVFYSQVGATQTAINAKQDALVSGTNIKTVNGTSLLGSGNISISGGVGSFTALSDRPTTLSGYGITDGVNATTYNTNRTADQAATTAAQNTANAALPASQIASQTDATTGSDNTKYMTPLRTLQAIQAGTTTLQAETITYISRIAATGDYIDAVSIQAVDKFFVQGKIDGWLSRLVDVWCPLGSGLNAALVKLIAASGTATSLTNNNFVSADYNPLKGLTGASGKYLATGVIPNSFSLTSNNVSFGAFLQGTDNSGWALGLTPSGGTTSFAVGGSEFGFYSPSFSQVYHSDAGIRIGNFSASLAELVDNGSAALSSSAIANSAVMTSELNYFRTYIAGAPNYTSSTIAFAFIGQSLTAAQSRSLSRAIMALNKAVGRGQQVGGVAIGNGDSIIKGVGATGNSNRWFTLVCQALASAEINVGVPSSQLRQGFNNVQSGYARYTDVNTIPANTVISMYGTNDMNQADGTSNGDATIIGDFTTKYNTMVANWKAAGFRVILVSPPWISTQNDTKISAYVAAVASVAATNSVLFVDAYHIYSDLASPSGYFSDGIHPNNAGHKLLAQAVLAAIAGRSNRYPTLDFPSIAAGASSDLTTTMYGARAGMSVGLGQPTSPTSGIVYSAFVSANDTVTIRATNVTGSAIDPAASSMRVTVFLDPAN